MNDQNRLRLVLVHYSFFLMHYYISFTPTLLHFGYLFVKLFKGHTSRPLKHRLNVEMNLLIRFFKETNSINKFAYERSGSRGGKAVLSNLRLDGPGFDSTSRFHIFIFRSLELLFNDQARAQCNARAREMSIDGIQT